MGNCMTVDEVSAARVHDTITMKNNNFPQQDADTAAAHANAPWSGSRLLKRGAIKAAGGSGNFSNVNLGALPKIPKDEAARRLIADAVAGNVLFTVSDASHSTTTKVVPSHSNRCLDAPSVRCRVSDALVRVSIELLVPCSQEMDDQQMVTVLIDTMTRLEVPEGTVIIKQGDQCVLHLLRDAGERRESRNASFDYLGMHITVR